MASTSDSSTRQATGLRERKKAKTRAAIQRHALRLFSEQGYAETTVDQIAEAAEISPSTFFRYFPTKEAVVLNDEYDPLLVDAMRAQPPESNPITAMRAAMRDVRERFTSEDWAQERARTTLILSRPELRAAVIDQVTQTVTMLAEVIAEREGHPPGDIRVRILAGAIVGAIAAALSIGPDMSIPEDLLAVADRVLAELENGLPLVTYPRTERP